MSLLAQKVKNIKFHLFVYGNLVSVKNVCGPIITEKHLYNKHSFAPKINPQLTCLLLVRTYMERYEPEMVDGFVVDEMR